MQVWCQVAENGGCGFTEFTCQLQQGQPLQTAVKRRERRRKKERSQQNLNLNNSEDSAMSLFLERESSKSIWSSQHSP